MAGNLTTWGYDRAAHLLLRAGFGHNGIYNKSKGEVRQVRSLANLTPDEAVDKLLRIPVSKARGPATLGGGDAGFAKLQRWWFEKMRTTGKPLREKMVLFLHTHFATARSTVTDPLYMAIQIALFREFVIGDFRELVKRVTVDPAMLWWLDGKLNKTGKPNENYARELQELFTLGVFDFNGQPNYSQEDVVQAAKILTGWRTYESKGNVLLDTINFSARHDTSSKVMYAPAAETPNQNPANQFTVPANYSPDGEEYRFLIDKIFAHVDTEGRPTAARYITRKTWKFFAYDPVVDVGTSRADLPLIDALADEFTANSYSLASLLRAMFLREEFYADATRTVKNPTEYVIGSLRMLRAKVSSAKKDSLSRDGLANMGQELLNPPDVFSWRGNLFWITTQTIFQRYDFGRDLATGDKSRTSDIGFNVYSFLDTSETTRDGVVTRFLNLLGPLEVDATTKATLIAWLGATDGDMHLLDDAYVQVRVRGLVSLILTLPQYHTH